MKNAPLSVNLLALALGLASPAIADDVFTDDIIGQVNLCVGTSCTNGEVFTPGLPLKLNANAIGIEFDDNAGNADNDWAIRINNSTQEFFSIEDVTLGLTPFQIFAGAGASAIVVEQGGDVGMGTTLPDADLHIVDAGNASMILESTSLNAAWEVAVGSTGFVLLDDEAGTAPFVIENNAPASSFWLSDIGDLGIGPGDPSAALHVQRDDGSAKILVEETNGGGAQELFQMKSNGGSYFTLTNTTSSRDWFFTHENAAAGRFIITSSTNPSQGLFLAPNGNMTIGGTLTTGGGTCGGGCDAVFTEDYDLPSIAEHTDAMWSLGYLPNVGPTPEYAPINVSDKLGRMLNELEHAHIFIGQLDSQLQAELDRNARQEDLIAALSARLDAIESN